MPVTITLEADDPITAGSFTNYAEVTAFTDDGGTPQTDVDSDTDLGAGNDPNEIDDDISNGPDHDDLDPGTIEIADVYDLALQKTSATPASILPGRHGDLHDHRHQPVDRRRHRRRHHRHHPDGLQPRRRERRHLERRCRSHRQRHDDARRTDRGRAARTA